MSEIISLMLQTNPSRRPNCDEILKNEILIRNMNLNKEYLENKNKVNQPLQLLGTIKFPRNLNEINKKLPKKKINIQEK